jgi:hypothetical protein
VNRIAPPFFVILQMASASYFATQSPFLATNFQKSGHPPLDSVVP